MSEKRIAERAKEIYDEHKELANNQYAEEYMANVTEGNIIRGKSERVTGDKSRSIEFLEEKLNGAKRHAKVAALATEGQVSMARADQDDNKEAYQRAAIEAATTAGHDINFGSEHYPAHQSEQTKEPEV